MNRNLFSNVQWWVSGDQEESESAHSHDRETLVIPLKRECQEFYDHLEFPSNILYPENVVQSILNTFLRIRKSRTLFTVHIQKFTIYNLKYTKVLLK